MSSHKVFLLTVTLGTILLTGCGLYYEQAALSAIKAAPEERVCSHTHPPNLFVKRYQDRERGSRILIYGMAGHERLMFKDQWMPERYSPQLERKMFYRTSFGWTIGQALDGLQLREVYRFQQEFDYYGGGRLVAECTSP